MAKLIKVYDFKQCELPEPLFKITIKQKDIDHMVFKAAEHFLTIEDRTDEIQEGDIVAVKIKSDDAFVASECERMTVGKGYFSPEIEEALMGKKKGDSFGMTVDGAHAEIDVLWVKRRVVPELNDEMAAKLEIEDVTSRDEYIAYATSELENVEKEKKQNAIWLMVSKELLAKSEFDIDDAEIEEQYKKDLAYMERELDSDFEEYMQVKYHGKTLDECKQNFKKEIEKTLKICAIAQPMAEEDGIEWTKEEYEAVIADMVSEDYTEEELKASMSCEDYVKQQQEAFLQGKILEYFDERFETTII